jgi:hypothetical protein
VQAAPLRFAKRASTQNLQSSDVRTYNAAFAASWRGAPKLLDGKRHETQVGSLAAIGGLFFRSGARRGAGASSRVDLSRLAELRPHVVARRAVAPAGAEPARHQVAAPVDLAPQYSGSNLLIHYGSPLVTRQNNVVFR